jgi:hypothetical protein
VTPADEDGLWATFAEADRRYTGAINARFRWTGRLFQGRFGVMAHPRGIEYSISLLFWWDHTTA